MCKIAEFLHPYERSDYTAVSPIRKTYSQDLTKTDETAMYIKYILNTQG